jgi:hypothetical protein
MCGRSPLPCRSSRVQETWQAADGIVALLPGLNGREREGDEPGGFVGGNAQQAQLGLSELVDGGLRDAFRGGNADIYVPEGLNVDVSGLTVFGHRRDWGDDLAAADAPAICVRVIGVLGTIDVWRVPRGLSGDYGDVMRHLQGKPPKALE